MPMMARALRSQCVCVQDCRLFMQLRECRDVFDLPCACVRIHRRMPQAP